MNILEMSVQAGVLIVVTLVLRAFTLHRLPKKMFLALWGAVLLRLLVPFSLPSRFSVYSLAAETGFLGEEGVGLAVVRGAMPLGGASWQSSAAMEPADGSGWGVLLIFISWLVGAALLVVWFLTGYVRERRVLSCALPVLDDTRIGVWVEKQGLRRQMVVLRSDRITTPVAMGVLRPHIILPKTLDNKDGQLLDHVLAHELYHIKRFDAVWKLLLVAALCVHWFNPLVWVMFVLAGRDLEITCDEGVVGRFASEEKAAYAFSLIRMAEHRRRRASINVGFSRNAAEERIKAIMKYKKTTVLGVALSAVLVTCAVVLFGTTAMAERNGVVPQDTGGMAEYDSKGDFVAAYVPDKNGRMQKLDYLPESPKGDTQVQGYEDVFAFVSEEIPCVDGLAGEHKRSNGQMAVYTDEGGGWLLNEGQAVNLAFDTKLVEGFTSTGQGIWFGYVLDEEYIRYGYDPDLEEDQRYMFLGKTSIEFVAPEDGEYQFFMVNFCSDTIYVNSVEVVV